MTEKMDRSVAEESTEEVAGGEVGESTVEASNTQGMEPFWKDGRNPDPSRRCTARRTNGEPCRKIAIRGGTVCRTHGGASPQVKAKARARLEMAADRMAKELLGIATDGDAPAAVKLAAIKDALDRAGLSAKTAVSVEVGVDKPFEQVIAAALAGGSRADSRAARGVEDEPGKLDWLREELDAAAHSDEDAEPQDDPNIIDAETVDYDPPTRPAPADDTGLMTYEDALAQLRQTSPPPAPVARRRRRT